MGKSAEERSPSLPFRLMFFALHQLCGNFSLLISCFLRHPKWPHSEERNVVVLGLTVWRVSSLEYFYCWWSRVYLRGFLMLFVRLVRRWCCFQWAGEDAWTGMTRKAARSSENILRHHLCLEVLKRCIDRAHCFSLFSHHFELVSHSQEVQCDRTDCSSCWWCSR